MILVLARAGFSGQSLAQAPVPSLEIKISQAHFTGDRLDFDILLRSLKPDRHFLGFTDVVLAFDQAALHDTAQLIFWPGSSQLMSGEQQRIDKYETRYNFKFDRTGDRILVYIGIDPPRFKGLSEFVATIAHIDERADFHRIGRFSLTGIQQVPDVLRMHVADKGLHTQAYHFVPANNFLAEATVLQLPPLNLMNQSLEMFEAVREGEQVNLQWEVGEVSRWKSLSLERSYDLQSWEEVQFLATSSRSVSDVPEPPVYLEGSPLVYYRLLITPQRGKSFYGPVRSIQF